MSESSGLIIMLVPAVAMLVLPQMSHLRAQATARNIPVTSLRLAMYAIASVACALCIGLGAAWAVIFGRSHSSGNAFDLPWPTLLSAAALGAVLIVMVSRSIGAFLLGLSERNG